VPGLPSKGGVHGDYESHPFLLGHCLSSHRNAYKQLPALKKTLQINTLNYCWCTGDLEVGREEIGVLKMKLSQDFFFQLQTTYLPSVHVYFFCQQMCVRF